MFTQLHLVPFKRPFSVEIFHHISQLPGELTDGQPLFAGESEVRALHAPKGPQRSALV
jgi:hypothetical protein